MGTAKALLRSKLGQVLEKKKPSRVGSCISHKATSHGFFGLPRVGGHGIISILGISEERLRAPRSDSLSGLAPKTFRGAGDLSASAKAHDPIRLELG